MASSIKISLGSQSLLRCPACRSELQISRESCDCLACHRVYPVLNGVPVLIHEENSVFTVDDFVNQRNTTFGLTPSRSSRVLKALTPNISVNWVAQRNYARLSSLLLQDSPAPRALILGGSVLGEGFETLTSVPTIELIDSDVSFGPRTGLICDGHDIPFADGSLEGVIAQAVLEHVSDPHRVVAEIHRVLRPGGIVYAETPFMQQMHGGRYDFERFSYWGHRRLFRAFEEIDSGITAGPGISLAWAWTYFLRSLAPNRWSRHLFGWFGSLTSWWLKYFDRFLIQQANAIEAASGYYFMGRRADTLLSDRELVKSYKVAGGR